MTGHATIIPVEDPIAEAARLIGSALDMALIERTGPVGLLLSGGRTPQAILPLLLERNLDWPRVEVAASDERLVPIDNPLSTEGMIRSAFERSGRPINYRSFGANCEPHAALKTWHAQLADMPWPPAVALLGMGEDAHVASLFPGRCEASDADLFAAAVPCTPPHKASRLTLGAAALRACPAIVMVVTGHEKDGALKASLAPDSDPAAFPAAHIVKLPQTTIFVSPNGPSIRQLEIPE